MNKEIAEPSLTESEKKLMLRAWRLMSTARAMSHLYETKREITSKYVHATSRGHEAIQLAAGFQLQPQDFVYPYYRDDALLLAIGMQPYELMLQLLAKRDDPFSGGRTYYSHPSLRDDDKPKIPHQSSATGMQAIPATGAAMGLKYRLEQKLDSPSGNAVVICSIGDAAMTEGEISEALQMAALKQLPIIFLVQDNGWDISAKAEEIRANDAIHYARGFKGLESISVDGTDFAESHKTLQEVVAKIRTKPQPYVIHASVPLLSHHTSGVRMETYRDDLEDHQTRDPWPRFQNFLLDQGFSTEELNNIASEVEEQVKADFEKAINAPDPTAEDLFTHAFAPTPVTEEKGNRAGTGSEKSLMVDCALFAVKEILEKHPEALLYGQDVGARLGGVFREAATLGKKFGDNRVFNTPIMEAFIIGSTAGMSATGCKPIVEVQFADYIWPGLNQLFTELSRSYYLSNGKWPVSSVIRVPIGAYGSGGPYHSSSVESVLTNIRGIKIAYPSCGADLKGLLKAAYYDPNPVVILEHKGLYWSKIPGTEDARSVEPGEDYVLPFGKANIIQTADDDILAAGKSMTVIAYGMGVYWAKSAAKSFSGRIEIIDLRTLVPIDEDLILERVKHHGRCLIVTEEPVKNTFASSLAGLIQQQCFEKLDAPVRVVGSEDLPAIPLNSTLEQTMIPNADKVQAAMEELLNY